MIKYRCDICGSEDTYVKDFEHEYPVKDSLIKITSKNRFCSKCNNHVYDPDLDNETLKKVFREYTKQIGVPAESIVELRRNYNLSQAQFAKIIGCAKKTLVSYENGNSIPNDVYLVTIKTLIENPEVIKPLIESNRDRYSEEEYEKITRRLTVVEKETDELTDLNGYTEYSYEKIKEMMSLLSQEGILKTKFLKEMFYCDFLNYKYTACNITGLEYSKLDFGPVPDNFENIIEQLKEDGILTETIEYKGEYECHIIKSKDIKIKNLTKDEIDIINRVKEHFKDYSSKEIVDYSHKKKAFKETDFYKNISYTYADDLEDI